MICFGEKEPGIRYQNRKTVYGIYETSGKFVCVEVQGMFFLPGGGINKNERPGDALKREFIEELGWEIEIVKPVGSAIQHFYSKNDEAFYESHALFYRVNVTSTNKSRVENDHYLRWVPVENSAVLRFEHFKWALNQAI